MALDTVLETNETRILNEIKYSLIEELGVGGEATVYKALTEENKLVTIKQFHKPLTPDQKEKVNREIRIRNNLPLEAGTPKMIDFGETKIGVSTRFMHVTEHRSGDDLASKINNGWRPTGGEVNKIIVSVLERLKHFHQRGIIHRDIKPSNVLLGADGSVYFTDLGTICDNNRKSETVTMMGTPDYTAVEQFSDKPTLASDIYSVGILAHYLLSRKDPDIEISLKYDPKRDDVDFSEIDLDFSKKEATIYQKMVATDENKRYANASETLLAFENKDNTMFSITKRKKDSLIAKVFTDFWDKIRYKKMKITGRIAQYEVLKKRFGKGPEILVLDKHGNRKFQCDQIKEIMSSTSEEFDCDEEVLIARISDSEKNLDGYAFIKENGTVLLQREGKCPKHFFTKILNGTSGTKKWMQIFSVDEEIDPELKKKYLLNDSMPKTAKHLELICMEEGKVWADEYGSHNRIISGIINIYGITYTLTQIPNTEKEMLLAQDNTVLFETKDHIEKIIDSNGKVRLLITDRDLTYSYFLTVDENGSVTPFGKRFVNSLNKKNKNLLAYYERIGMEEFLDVDFLNIDGEEFALISTKKHPATTAEYQLMSKKGTLIGDGKFQKIELIESSNDLILLQKKNKHLSIRDRRNKTLFDVKNKLLSFQWYSEVGGLEVISLENAHEYFAVSGMNSVTLTDKNGKPLYLSDDEREYSYCEIINASEDAIKILPNPENTREKKVLRELVIKYDTKLVYQTNRIVKGREISIPEKDTNSRSLALNHRKEIRDQYGTRYKRKEKH